MVNSFPLLLIIGAVIGFLAGLGVGGGSLLVLWLTVVAGMQAPDARAINLIFYIVAATSASVFRVKKGSLRLKPLLPAIGAGIISAAVFSYIGTQLDAGLLNKGFGILLLIVGSRELAYRPRKDK